jgi:hypothetical protein
LISATVRGVGLFVLLVVLAARATSTSAAQLEPGLQLLPDTERGSAGCGPASVVWSLLPASDEAPSGVAVLQAAARDGRILLNMRHPLAPGERLMPLWCGDVLGDGSQALAFELFTGGAHCCFSASVVLLRPDSPHLLDADLGNGGLVQPRQLDGAGPLELPATSDVFAYFDGLSYAASPSMPLVFAFDGTRYAEATRQFPDVLRVALSQSETDLANAIAQQESSPFAVEEQQSIALRLYALHVLLGDGDEALPRLQAQVLPTVAEWLQANAAAAAEQLSVVYTS